MAEPSSEGRVSRSVEAIPSSKEDMALGLCASAIDPTQPRIPHADKRTICCHGPSRPNLQTAVRLAVPDWMASAPRCSTFLEGLRKV